MARLELNIADVGLIELGDETNSPLRLNKRLSDISLLTKRSDVYSYTFKVPDTKSNKKTLQYYYHSRYNNHINIDEEKECDVLINGSNFQKGKATIKSSSFTDGIRTYTIQFKGGNIDWWAQLKNYTLADLDWSGISPLTLSYANIISSWTNTYTDGYVFADIDRGRAVFGSYISTLSTEVPNTIFRPELFMKFVLEKIETLLDVTFESAFFDSANFKKLIITYFSEKIFGVRDDVLEDNTASTKMTVSGTAHSFNAGWFNGIITYLPMGGTWADVSDPNSMIDTAGQITTPLSGLVYTAKCNVNLDVYGNGNPIQVVFQVWNVTDNVNATTSVSNSVDLTFETTASVSTPDEFYCEITFISNAGKTYEIRYLPIEITSFYDHNLGQPVNTIEGGINHQILLDTTIEYLPSKSVFDLLLYTFNIEDILDNNITLFDIFGDLVRMFNLFAETDQITNNIIIEPRKDFYGDIIDAEEVSERLDTSKEIVTTFNSEKYNRYLNFKYKEDVNDGNLKVVNENKDFKHMAYVHDYGLKFKGGTVDMSLKVFAPTLLEPHWDAAADFNNPSIPILTARYWQTQQVSAPPFKELKTPRILNYVHATQTASATGVNRVLSLANGTTHTTLPAAVPFSGDGVTAPMNLSFEGSDGLVATYYDDIIDIIETGKTMDCYMFWDEEKYKNSDFRRIKHFEEPEFIKGYWILESIEGYDPLVSGMYKTRLLQIVPSSGIQIASQQPDIPDTINTNGMFGDISASINISKNAIVEGSLGVGKGLISTLPGSIVKGFYNEDSPGALEIMGNGTPKNRTNLYIIDANGKKIESPEIMTAGGVDLYYEQDENGVNKYIY